MTMTPRNDRAHREIVRFLESAKALRDELRSKEANYRRMAKLLDRGDDIRTILAELNAADARQELTDALEELERSRHRVKIAVAATGLDEGMTIGELGRAWGVSRQLAARYAKEARSSG